MDITDINDKTTVEDFLSFKKEKIRDFLKKNGGKISGNKLELSQRAFQLNRSIHGLLDQTSDSQATQTSQQQPLTDSVPDITELNSGWTSDKQVFPRLTHKEVEAYLLHSSHRSDDRGKMMCYRQFIRGFNFYKEKYLHKVMVNEIEASSKLCYVRSKCHPSMKQGTYIQWILVEKEQPHAVHKANCTCPAGLGEGCTHIAGLLFALEAISCTNEDLPCTSKPCEWNKPGKRKRKSETVENLQFKKIKHGKPEEYKEEHSFKIEENIVKDFTETLTRKLGDSDAVLFDLLPPTVQEPAEISCDLNVSVHEEVATSEHITYVSDRYIDLKKTVVEEKLTCDQFVRLTSDVPDEVIAEVEDRTKGQASNPAWVKARSCRITSSNFHDIHTRKKDSTSNKLASKFLAGNDTAYANVPSLKWGRKQEPLAKKRYIAYLKLKHNRKVRVRECGLFLCPEAGYLGASPDGIVSGNSGEPDHLLEIKCPYKWRDSRVHDACHDRSFYCYIGENGDIKLKTNHKYYTQVQGQMAICNFKMCDFVVCTKKDIQVIRINFDKSFWEALKPKLKLFFCTNVAPQAVTDTC